MNFNPINLRNQYYEIVKSFEGFGSKRKVHGLDEINKTFLPNSSIGATSYKEKIRISPIISDRIHEFPWFSELKSIFEQGEEEGIINNIIVHGSYGDYSYTNFSDLDITIILEEDIFRNIRKYKCAQRWVLERVYPFLFKVDPLQHHGPFYLWPTLIKNYRESILPLDVYKYSWGLKEQELDFAIINDFNCLGLSQITCQALINNKLRFFSNGYSMYALKRYLSNLMILPAFYFSDINRPIHKKESFVLFKDRYKNAQEMIDISTHIRSTWPETPAILGLLRSRLFEVGGRGKSQSILQQVYQHKLISKIVKKDLIPKVNEFCHSFMQSST